jgi:hypothetical protein
MLTVWRFWRFSDTIKWLLSWSCHGRGSRPGRVLRAPSRGASSIQLMGMILPRFGEKCDRVKRLD